MLSVIQKLNSSKLVGSHAISKDVGLLILRLFVGLSMAFAHGLGKMQKLFSGGEVQFLDPIGIGVLPSLALAGLAEFVCSLLLVLGLFTRGALIPLMITMAVAVFIVHPGDGYGKQELPLMFLVAYITLFFTGPGRFSVK